MSDTSSRLKSPRAWVPDLQSPRAWVPDLQLETPQYAEVPPSPRLLVFKSEGLKSPAWIVDADETVSRPFIPTLQIPQHTKQPLSRPENLRPIPSPRDFRKTAPDDESIASSGYKSSIVASIAYSSTLDGPIELPAGQRRYWTTEESVRNASHAGSPRAWSTASSSPRSSHPASVAPKRREVTVTGLSPFIQGVVFSRQESHLG